MTSDWTFLRLLSDLCSWVWKYDTPIKSCEGEDNIFIPCVVKLSSHQVYGIDSALGVRDVMRPIFTVVVSCPLPYRIASQILFYLAPACRSHGFGVSGSWLLSFSILEHCLPDTMGLCTLNRPICRPMPSTVSIYQPQACVFTTSYCVCFFLNEENVITYVTKLKSSIGISWTEQELAIDLSG